MPGNVNYNTLLSTTLKNYRPTFVDNIFKHNFLFQYMFSKQGGMDSQGGGTKIIAPLMYGDNATFQWYDGYDPLITTPQEGFTAAEFDWRQAAASVTISGKEERMNSGEQQLINLLKAKITQAEKSMQAGFALALFAIGTGKQMNGLPYFIRQSPAGAATVAGIPQSTNAWWRNYTIDATKTTAIYDRLKLCLFKLYNRTSDGDDHIDLMIADIATFEGWEDLLTATINVHPGLTNTKLADMGFDNYKVKGATLGWDNNAIANTVHGINTDYLKMVVHPAANFTNTPFITPENQDARTAKILWMGNLTCSNRARQGLLYNAAS